jgi:hypothetical protein
MKTNILKLSLAILAMVSFSVFTSCSKDEEETPKVEPKNIVQVASDDARFSILVEAVTKLILLQPFRVQVPLQYLHQPTMLLKHYLLSLELTAFRILMQQL